MGGTVSVDTKVENGFKIEMRIKQWVWSFSILWFEDNEEWYEITKENIEEY